MNAPEEWTLANQRALAAGVARIRRRIEGQGQERPPRAADVTEGGGAALARLCQVFGLTSFERDLLLLCAAPELDGSFPAAPTFGLALAVLAEPHWSALLPQAPLRWWRLIRMAPGAGLTEARLHIDECILHTLAGIPCMDERVAATVRPLPPPDTLPTSQSTVSDHLAGAWSRTSAAVQLVGPAAETDAVAAQAAATLGWRLFAVAAGALVGAPEDWVRLWQREALLDSAALLIECDGTDQPGLAALAALLHRDLRTQVVLATATSLDLPGLTTSRLTVARPTPGEQALLWRRELQGHAEADAAAIDRLVNHFDLGTAAIGAAAHAAGHATDCLWAACRAQEAAPSEHAPGAAPRAAGWADLALPPAQEAMLHEMVAQIRNRHVVQDRWGFGERLRRGMGVSALFHGPSGTGKSLAAEVIASVLELDLHEIDLSRVVSKYIGDTERHLRAVFAAAEASGAVLLFDEADALFGKRSEVRDSHDRYANIEVSYLLQRIEQYRGLAILTTNLKDAIDTAFLRRIRFIVQFPHPGPAERARIWQRVLPEDAPREKIDFGRLAQVNLAGGHIRNIALAAAYLAADAGEPIRMAHLLHATNRECAKLERPLTQSEIAGWL